MPPKNSNINTVIPGQSFYLSVDSALAEELVLRFPGNNHKINDNSVTFLRGGIAYQQRSAISRENLTESFIQNSTYSPQIHDFVLGRVSNDHPLMVDILTSQLAFLSPSGAQNATQSSPLNFKVGDLILCRVINTVPYLEVDCRDFQGKTEDAGMGLLEGGDLVKISQIEARRILGGYIASDKLPEFDYATGANGLLWFKATQEESQDLLKEKLEENLNRFVKKYT